MLIFFVLLNLNKKLFTIFVDEFKIEGYFFEDLFQLLSHENKEKFFLLVSKFYNFELFIWKICYVITPSTWVFQHHNLTQWIINGSYLINSLSKILVLGQYFLYHFFCPFFQFVKHVILIFKVRILILRTLLNWVKPFEWDLMPWEQWTFWIKIILRRVLRTLVLKF